MTTPNLDLKRHGSAMSAMTITAQDMPNGFPMIEWTQQASRYLSYWKWFDGTYIEEVLDSTKGNEPIYKFPLRINAVRNFARKHATVLLGEEIFDSPEPLVKTVVTPKKFLSDAKVTDEETAMAQFLQSVASEVWQSSNGRALQSENAVLTQFLGGCIFGLKYVPWEEDLAVPIIVENIPPDFFLPVWSKDDYYNLLEAWIVYRVPARVAALEWKTELRNQSYALYVEHWTRDHYSIYIDNEPLVDQYGITYENLENIWGFVPFVYIPHLREGNFYGPSIIEDIEGLVKEYNARMADQGDAIRKTVHRIRYAFNINRTPISRLIGNNVRVIDLGQESPAQKNPPKVYSEDPPNMSDSMMNFSDDLWAQLMREASLGPIAFGEDEGSQRSALTLAFRMWPTTSHARMERTFWTDGLNRIAYMILKMVAMIQADKKFSQTMRALPMVVPKDFYRDFRLSQDWLPQIPRDREQMVNEIVIRYQAGLLSIDTALQSFGDIRNIKNEKDLIIEWKDAVAKVEAKYALTAKPTSKPQGAETEVTTPVASTHAGEED
jgi:hypothetical protein